MSPLETRRRSPSSSRLRLKKYIWSIVMFDRAVRPIRQRASVVRPAAAPTFVIAFALVAAAPACFAQSSQNTAAAKGETDGCAPGNGGITLSPGFCATVFADNLGHARQMAFGTDGVLYVNTWSGTYYPTTKSRPAVF
jgi:glucose/arabinose dehydrogenase